MCNAKNSPEVIQRAIKTITDGIPGAEVEIKDLTGTNNHLEIKVVSDVFKGKMLIKQHQIIMDLLKESLKSDIHAVILKTYTIEQAQKQNVA
jgi:stress-induced morphogen